MYVLVFCARLVGDAAMFEPREQQAKWPSLRHLFACLDALLCAPLASSFLPAEIAMH